MRNEAADLETGGTIIYVAGAPDLYPLEFYDPDSQSYQGAIPAFLEDFAQAYGYDLRYLQPGERDRREQLAVDQQVDLISGCLEEERYAHTAGEPLLLFSAQEGGEERAYVLRFTQVSPSRFREDLREYAAGRSQAEWTGAVLAAAEAPQASIPLPVLVGAGLALLLLAGAVAALLFRLRRRRREEGARLTDPETGLGTEEALEQAFSKLGESRAFRCLVCFHLDLDRIGRLWGREQAQALLLRAAQTLEQEAAPTDPLFRTGGGDLVALKHFLDKEGALAWAGAAVETLRSIPFAGGVLGPQDLSAGVFPLGSGSRELGAALFHARQCALSAGREEGTCRLCGTERCRTCQERWQLLADFEKALERSEFYLYVQFFVDADTFHVVGGEALSRWHHPRLGLLSPGRYVPLLEDNGMVSRLDLYGLERACAFLEELVGRGVEDFFLSCNFARSTFSASDFVQKCVQVIQGHAFPRKLLILEVTESQEISPEEAAQMLRNIQALRDFGARVIFDDFGMGFSSFHDLQNYPMDGLKLDKELVDNMDTEQGRIILEGLVETGHRMGLTILAEGVEREEQIETLQRLHCDVLQGFRFSVPLPAAEAQRIILEKTRPGRDGTRERTAER